MAETLSLWEFLRELVTNAGLRASFTEDPQGALRANGLDHLSPDDVHDALVLAQDNQTADFSPDYGIGHHAIGAPSGPLPGESEHEAAIRYLNGYVTDNHVDGRDPIVGHSTGQQFGTHGGDFDRDIDVHSGTASGDGDHHQAEEPLAGSRVDAVTGDHDTSAFGSGNATSTTVHGDVTVDDGAFASGGNATVDDSDHSQHDVGNQHRDNPVDDSFKDSGDHSVHHSFTTHVDAGTNDSFDEHDEQTTSHSFDDESDRSTHVDNSLDHVGNVSGH